MKKVVFLLLCCFILLTGLSYAWETSEVQMHGFLSQGFIKTDHNNYMSDSKEGSFEFNELGLNFTTAPVARLRLGAQFFARDLGNNGNDELSLDWASADYRWRDFLGFRVGRVKNNYGYYASVWDFDMFRNGIFIPRIYAEMLRDTFSVYQGFSFYGDVNLGILGSLSYDLLHGLSNTSEDSGVVSAWEDYWQDAELDVTTMGIDFSFNYNFKWETPLEGLMLGTTLYRLNNMDVQGTLMDGAANFHEIADWIGLFLTLRYSWRDFVIMAEMMQNDMRKKIDIDAFNAGFLPDENLDALGWYGSLAWQFTDRFTMEYMYTEFYSDKNNKDGKSVYDNSRLHQYLGIAGKPKQKNDFEAWTKSSTFTFRFDITSNWLVKLETSYNDGFGEYSSTQNDTLKRYWWLYAAKVTYAF